MRKEKSKSIPSQRVRIFDAEQHFQGQIDTYSFSVWPDLSVSGCMMIKIKCQQLSLGEWREQGMAIIDRAQGSGAFDIDKENIIACLIGAKPEEAVKKLAAMFEHTVKTADRVCLDDLYQEHTLLMQALDFIEVVMQPSVQALKDAKQKRQKKKVTQTA